MKPPTKNRNRLVCRLLLLLIFLMTGLSSNSLLASYCPFCSAIALTFSEQLDSNDVVVVAKLLEVPPPSDDLEADFPKAKFEIVQVLKGEKYVDKSMKFRTQLVGSYPAGQKFLVMGVDPPKIAWTTPMKASDLVFGYLDKIQSLPKKGPERLIFFQDYFEHDESVLAFDAYDEFARAPYEDLIAMKDQMQHDKLIGWIQDPETSVNRRRLYFTMLGVCGTENDIKVLEELIKSDDRKKRAGLDALIASYLMLKGAEGVDLIEKTFLTNKEVDYVDTLAAVSALRFHGTEVEVVPRDRIVAAVRRLLDRPKMADMIIPDLARWEDWTVMERLVQMFKDADEETNWLRVPVITYLRACPRKEAAGYITELAKIDPDAVRRADFFLGGFEDDEDEEEEDGVDKDSDSPIQQDGDSDSKSGQDSDGEVDGLTQSPTKGKPSGLNDDESTVPVTILTENETDIDSANPPTEAADEVTGTTAFDNGEIPDAAENESTIQKTETILTPDSNFEAATFVSSSAGEPVDALPAGQVAQSIPEASVAASTTAPNLTWSIIFIPMGISLGIFLLLWSVVNGWFERLIF